LGDVPKRRQVHIDRKGAERDQHTKDQYQEDVTFFCHAFQKSDVYC